VLLTEESGGWRLTTNGLPEALIQPPGALLGRLAATRWLSLLSVAARPEARSLLVVGLGGGSTIENLPPSIQDVEVVELEPQVVAANRSVASLRRTDPLADPRVRVRMDDARSALRLTGRRFDAIVSQPSHPWTGGAANLFTREFYGMVRDRLTPGGVFVQWMGLGFVDEPLLRSLVATVTASFGHVELYQPPPGASVFLVASEAPIGVESGAAAALAAGREAFADIGVLDREDILATRVLDEEGCGDFGRGAPVNTDSRNLLQTGSPRAFRQHLRLADTARIFAKHDTLRHPPADADRLYLVRRLLEERAVPRALRLAVGLHNEAERRAAFALIDLASGHADRGRVTLVSMLPRRPLGAVDLLDEVEPSTASREARFALLLIVREAALSPEVPSGFRQWAASDPTASALIAAWQRIAAGDPAGVEALEPQLAVLDPRHPVFRPASHLRAVWREATKDPARAREAISILDPVIASRADIPDLLLRARLGNLAGDGSLVVASLWGLVETVEGRNLASVAREALGVLDASKFQGPSATALRARLSGVASRS
jgi:hypothetical protein